MLVANPMFAEAGGDTPEVCRCQAEQRVKIATAREIIGHADDGSVCPRPAANAFGAVDTAAVATRCPSGALVAAALISLSVAAFYRIIAQLAVPAPGDQ